MRWALVALALCGCAGVDKSKVNDAASFTVDAADYALARLDACRNAEGASRERACAEVERKLEQIYTTNKKLAAEAE